MKRVIIFLFFLIGISCARSSQQEPESFLSAEIKKVDDSLTMSPVDSLWKFNCDNNINERIPYSRSWSLLELEGEQLPVAKKISSPKIGSRYSASLSDHGLFYKLFPGKIHYGVGYDSSRHQMIHWYNPFMKRDSVRYFNWAPETVFPADSFNTTLLDTAIVLTQHQKTYKFLSFFTTGEMSPFFSGRFSGAAMGMAVFAQKGNHWELIAFSPYTGSYGSFSTPVVPGIYFTPKNIFISYHFSNGGPGEPYTDFREIFMLKDDRLVKITCLGNYGLYNTPTGHWHGTHRFENDSVMVLTTRGNFNPYLMNRHENWLIDVAPGPISLYIKNHRRDLRCVYFTMTSTFKLRKEKLVLVNESFLEE